MGAESDPELRAMAAEEVARLAPAVEAAREQLIRSIIPPDPDQGSLPPSAGNTAAPSRFGGLLARVFYDHFTADWVFMWMFLALKFVLQFWKAFKRPFPKIAATRSTAGAAAFRASAHPKCVHAVSPSRFQPLIPCGQIPECPNDAFQLLMSCAQATARRDAETGGESGLP
jgi:hypothetical protein